MAQADPALARITEIVRTFVQPMMADHQPIGIDWQDFRILLRRQGRGAPSRRSKLTQEHEGCQ